jgi:two-component system, OmpR family, sensor kinase
MMPRPLRRAMTTPRWVAAMPNRLRRAQLRTRVLAGVLSITLIALAAFDIAAVTALRGYLLSQTDSQLQNVLRLYRPLSAPQNFAISRVGPPIADQTKRVRKPGFSKARGIPAGKPAQGRIEIVGPRLFLPRILGQYFVVFVSSHESRVSVGGNPNLRSRLPANLSVLAASHRAQTVIGAGNAPLRLRAMRAKDGTLVVTTSLSDVNKTLGRLEVIIAIGSLVAALLVGLGIAWVVRRGLHPIETMAAQADRITAGDLTDRVSPHDAATEVGRLGTALNGMLARIEASIEERDASQEATRRFFADASHELRNPLASLRANAELYQQGALPHRPQVDVAMRRITLEAQRMSRLIDDMLRLARLDQHPGQQHDPIDLTALVRECAERAQITSPRRTWQACIAAGLVTAGDEELLRRAIDNLLANVCAHTPADTAATITAASRGSIVIVEISDNGPGVPACQLPRIFDRFYRAPAQTQHPGSGLGLAIVTAITLTHNGTAEASLNDPHGLRITLTFPVLGCSQPGPAQPPAASRESAPRTSTAAP